MAKVSYGSVPQSVDSKAPASSRAGMVAGIFKLALVVTAFAVVLKLLAIAFGGALVLTVLALGLLAVYALVFTSFCLASRPLVRSVVMIPVVAVRLQLSIVSIVLAYARRGFQPLYPQWDLSFEVMVLSMRYMFEEYGDVIAFENAAMLREPFAKAGRKILQSNCRQHNTIPEELQLNGLDHMWLRDPERKSKEHRIVVIHYHGGGAAMGHPLQDLELANETHTMLQNTLKDKYGLDVSVDVLLANYRKSPEHLYPTPQDDGFAMYQHVLEHEDIAPNHVILGGESAGGLMTLMNCLRIRDGDLVGQQPLGCLLYSPCVDIYVEGDDEKTPHCTMPSKFVDSCNMIHMTDAEQRQKLSPVNRDLRNLPPMFVQYGTVEFFYDQIMRIIAKAKEQGVTNWQVDILENMPHAIVGFPTKANPAVKTAIQHGCDFAAKLCAKVLRDETRAAAAS